MSRMSQGTPRKFSEKIAILERKQNEEKELFSSVMRDVQAITCNKPSPVASPTSAYPCSVTTANNCGFSEAQCSGTTLQHTASPSTLATPSAHPLAFPWSRPGGSLPNVHQMVDLPVNDYAGWNYRQVSNASVQGHHVRTRSPGAHYHPYMNRGYPTGSQKSGERVPPLENHMIAPTIHLQPPDPSWSKARSDPTIHTNAMATTSGNVSYPYVQATTAQNSIMNWSNDYRNMGDAECSTISAMQHQQSNAPFQYPGQQQFQNFSQPSSMQQPQYSFNQQQTHSQGIPMSAQVLQTQQINISQSAANCVGGGDVVAGSLPNMRSSIVQNANYNIAQQQNQQNVNNRIGPMSVPPTTTTTISNDGANYSQQQQSVQHCKPNVNLQLNQQGPSNQQLTAAGINSSQSAPTSPAQGGVETPLAQQWPPARHYSASPDILDIPNIVLTGADGTYDCFQDLQDLHLDNEIQQLLNNPNSNDQVDPALETQLLN